MGEAWPRFWQAEVERLNPLVRPNGPRSGHEESAEVDGEAEEREATRRRTERQERDEQEQQSADAGELSGDEAQQDAQEDAQEGREPVIACDPGRPTREEFLYHRCTHWPFRAWCKHCVRGQPIASPHRSKKEEKREFLGEGRVPTISLDHCFLGSEKEAAAGTTLLMIYDDHSESLFAVALASKESHDWLAELVKSIIDELGFAGVRIVIKHDNAQELIKL